MQAADRRQAPWMQVCPQGPLRSGRDSDDCADRPTGTVPRRCRLAAPTVIGDRCTVPGAASSGPIARAFPLAVFRRDCHHLLMAGRPGTGESLAAGVHAQLRIGILDRRLTPGAQLKPAELAKRLGVSVNVMREALARWRRRTSSAANATAVST